jgi:hypothetical protein
MARKFRYYADPREIANYLEGLGYEVTERHDRQGKEARGFVVAGTTIDLSYDHVIDGKVVGHGLIRLQEGTLDPDPNNPYNNLVNDDPERYKQSLKLYRRLHSRFGRPKAT